MRAAFIAIYALAHPIPLAQKVHIVVSKIADVTPKRGHFDVFDLVIAFFLCSPLLIASLLTVDWKDKSLHYLRRFYAFLLIAAYVLYNLHQDHKAYIITPFFPLFMWVPLNMLWPEISSSFKEKKYRIYTAVFILSLIVLFSSRMQTNNNIIRLTVHYPYPDDATMIEHFHKNKNIFEELVHDFRSYREENDGGKSLDEYKNFIPYGKDQVMDQIKCARIDSELEPIRWWYPDPYSDYTAQVLSKLQYGYNRSDYEQKNEEIVEYIKDAFPAIQEGIAPIIKYYHDVRRAASPIRFDYDIPEYERGVANRYGYRHRIWCKAITKGYLYFPFSPPRIEDGYLRKPDFSSDGKPYTLQGYKVLDSLDAYPEDFNSFHSECFVKSIDAQWFLFLCAEGLGRPCDGKYREKKTSGRFGGQDVCLSREIPASHALPEAP